MVSLKIILNIISITFTIITSILSIILIVQRNNFNSLGAENSLRFRFFENILINSYFKLMMTNLFYDILFYSVTTILSKVIFKISKENNSENVLSKSVQDNMISNLLVEILFSVLIKGLALGFGIYYTCKLNEEIETIITTIYLKTDQFEKINQIKNIINVLKIINYVNIFYLGLYYIISFILVCKESKKKNFLPKKSVIQSVETK